MRVRVETGAGDRVFAGDAIGISLVDGVLAISRRVDFGGSSVEQIIAVYYEWISAEREGEQ